MNNDQSVNNDAPKVIALHKAKAQTKSKRLVRQARPLRKSAKKPKAKIGRVQRLRSRIERLEARLAKLRGRITLNEGRLAKAQEKLDKAVSTSAKSQKKARPKRAPSG